jgi:type VI secretion system secreted protein VgrG
LTSFARRQVQANAVSISSWDPAQLLAPGAEQLSSLDAGELPSLAVYDGGGERIASASGQPEHISQLMLQALELNNKVFEGEGAVRQLAAGHAFALTQHERYRTTTASPCCGCGTRRATTCRRK